MIDDMTFFHQATMKICGSLDIDKVVQECAVYLKGYLPLDGIMLCTYEPAKGAVRIHALTSTIPTDSWARPVFLSAEAQSALGASLDGVLRYRRSNDHPVARAVGAALGLPPFSEIVLQLKMDEQTLGVVVIYARGESRYSSEHARLMGLLHDPFAIAMANVLKHREVLRLKDLLDDDNRYLRQELHHISGDEIVGARYGLRGVMEMVRQVSPLNSHVMLTGETGVGKEVVANAIHFSSPRRDAPLVRVNCGAIAENLLDSELFGHEKGAFTGAIGRRRGRFERAHGGTLFLDEIGELPAAAQVRLLRVLQDGSIERVGGAEAMRVDVRVIAATHRNLEEMVKAGAFREDLWFRLNVFPIHIPPLRRRKSDIPALVHHFIDRKLRAFNLSEHPVLAPGTMARLSAYPWPGNVRELENMVERALIRYQSRGENRPLRFDDLTAVRSPCPDPAHTGERIDRPLTLDAAMRRHIETVLRYAGGKVQGKNGAAAVLGIHSSTLRSRMDKLGIAYGRKAGDTKKENGYTRYGGNGTFS